MMVDWELYFGYIKTGCALFDLDFDQFIFLDVCIPTQRSCDLQLSIFRFCTVVGGSYWYV